MASTWLSNLKTQEISDRQTRPMGFTVANQTHTICGVCEWSNRKAADGGAGDLVSALPRLLL